MQTISETLLTALAAGNPQRCLFIFHDDNGDETDEFTNEDIAQSRGVHTSWSFNAEKELTLGQCGECSISFAILNDLHQIDDFEFGEFTAYLGARIDEGTPDQEAVTRTYPGDGLYEFCPIGVFSVDRPDVVNTNMIDVSATDRMTKFDEEIKTEHRTALTASMSLYELADALCDCVGVPLGTEETDMLNADLPVQLTTTLINGRTYRDILKWIAEAAGSIAMFNRTGELEFRWFSVPVSGGEFDDNDFHEFVNSWYETQQIDGLRVRNQGETSEDVEKPESVEEITNAYVISGNPFLR